MQQQQQPSTATQSTHLFHIGTEIATLDQLRDLVGSNSCGAIATFLGTTRDTFAVDGVDKKVTRLEYEAYTEMAVKQIQAIAQTTRSKWPDIVHIAVHHRIGVVPAGEASIAIAVSSPHRKAALHSVEFLIDEVKRIAPIWKKEVYSDGTSNWKQNC
ncbi:Molybdopterin synthase catalytic subunit, partial [Chytriomyces hyalinus]